MNSTFSFMYNPAFDINLGHESAQITVQQTVIKISVYPHH